jgi:hypothetical protein
LHQCHYDDDDDHDTTTPLIVAATGSHFGDVREAMLCKQFDDEDILNIA